MKAGARTAALALGLLALAPLALLPTWRGGAAPPTHPAGLPAPALAERSAAPSREGAHELLPRQPASAATGAVEALTLPAPAAAGELVVRTVDLTGAAVARVPVQVYVEGRARLVGRSDLEGRLVARAPERSAATFFFAETERHVGRSQLVDAGATAEVVLPLHERASIRGRVRRFDGARAGPGIRVHARRWDTALPLEREVPPRDPSVREVSTDADGRFELLGLAAGASYVVRAGGGGWLTKEPAPAPVAAGRDDVVLTVHPGFVALARLVGPDGRPVVADTDRLGGGTATWRDPAGELESLPLGRAALLAGLPRALLASRRGELRVGSFVGGREAPLAGPVELGVALPGYEETTATLDAQSLAGPLAEQPVALRPLAAGTGSLRVVFRGAPAEWPPPSAGIAHLLLELRSPHDSLKYRLGEQYQRGALELAGVPCGTYELWLQGLPGEVPGLELPMTVEVPPEGAEVELDVSGAAGLRVQVLRASGERHEGFARLSALLERELRPASPGLTVSGPVVLRDFERAPYLVFPMAPGTYHLGLVFPFHSDAHAGHDPVRLAPGELRTVTFTEGR